MLEKKIKRFLEKGEKNIEVRFIKKLPHVENYWLKGIIENLGNDIISDSKNDYYVRCKTNKSEIDFATKGDEIIDAFAEELKVAHLVRFDIVKLPSKSLSSEKSLILVR